MSADQAQPMTLQQFIQFYEKMIEPRFQKIESKMEDHQRQTMSRFDDLYKKFEDLRQEYIVISASTN